MKKISMTMPWGLCVPLAMLGLLGGCGFGASPAPETPPTPVMQYMIDHSKGDTDLLDDPQFGEQIRITMQDTFTSAAGEECKRATLVAREREAEMAVICRKGEEGWKLAPRIWGQGIE